MPVHVLFSYMCKQHATAIGLGPNATHGCLLMFLCVIKYLVLYGILGIRIDQYLSSRPLGVILNSPKVTERLVYWIWSDISCCFSVQNI